MTTFVPPYPEAMTSNYSGYGNGSSVNGNGSAVSTSSAQRPETHDLAWVAGDTAVFDFFFPGVCRTDTDPGLAPDRPDGITWSNTVWMSQVRAKATTYWGYWWPPVWPGYRYVMSFQVSAEFVEATQTSPAGTRVTLQGGTIWPGQFLWDLQALTYADPDDPDAYTVRTWVSGKATIDQQVTQQAIYPPSHWPMYSPYVNPNWPSYAYA